MKASEDIHVIQAYLSGLGLGVLMRVRDHLREGRTDEALAAAREGIELHLRHMVEDADEAWIRGMVRGDGR